MPCSKHLFTNVTCEGAPYFLMVFISKHLKVFITSNSLIFLFCQYWGSYDDSLYTQCTRNEGYFVSQVKRNSGCKNIFVPFKCFFKNFSYKISLDSTLVIDSFITNFKAKFSQLTLFLYKRNNV